MLLAHATFLSPRRITEEIEHALAAVRYEWTASGQVLPGESRVIMRGRRITIEALIPDTGALLPRHGGARTRRALKALAELGVTGPRVEVIGRWRGSDGVCGCRTRAIYILFTHAYTPAPPVRCGSCMASVPLYRLPTDNGRELGRYWDARAWQEDYRRMDQMWFASGLGERYAFRELSRIDSHLNTSGREVRDRLEGKLRKPVYYFQWRSKIDGGPRTQNERCPLCGRRWTLRAAKRGALNEMFTHRCDRCRLVGM
jgi:predicted  nucleic acid-binding Zn ribbon protein